MHLLSYVIAWKNVWGDQNKINNKPIIVKATTKVVAEENNMKKEVQMILKNNVNQNRKINFNDIDF